MPKCSQIEEKGPSKHRGSQRFQEKGIFLAVLTQSNSFQLCESQCFLEKGSLSSPQMSAILKIRGHFFNEKVSEKGYLLILENDHTSPLLQTSGGTGGGGYRGDLNYFKNRGNPRVRRSLPCLW